jgi:hypothetical protein
MFFRNLPVAALKMALEMTLKTALKTAVMEHAITLGTTKQQTLP